MKNEFRRGWNKLSGIHEFNVSTDSVISDITVGGSRRFTGCTVVQIPQEKGRKPHLAIKDNSGITVFEVGARQSSAYSALSDLQGETLAEFSWKEERSTLKTDGSFLRCQATANHAPSYAEPPIRRIILDTETTGLHPQSDEILQLSIIDGFGNTLWNKYYRPTVKTTWTEAQRIHHISPADVRNASLITDDLGEIQSILDRAEQVCAFNAEYDMAFLGEAGLHLDTTKVVDTMRQYARKYHGKDFIKLTLAAKECGYTYRAHDALNDCKATLAVQSRVDGKAVTTAVKLAKAATTVKRLTDALKSSADLGTFIKKAMNNK